MGHQPELFEVEKAFQEMSFQVTQPLFLVAASRSFIILPSKQKPRTAF